MVMRRDNCHSELCQSPFHFGRIDCKGFLFN